MLRERLIVVTDRRRARGSLTDQVAAALAGLPPHTAVVMLREKDLPGRALVELARPLCAIARRACARLVVNDRVDVALAVGADGAHLPESGMTVAQARELLGPDALVGASVHDVAGVARRAGADYLMAGPVWETPGKEAIGVDGFAAIVSAAGAPLFAVGGVDVARADAALVAGAHGVAVIRALMEHADPAREAAAFAEVFLNR